MNEGLHQLAARQPEAEQQHAAQHQQAAQQLIFIYHRDFLFSGVNGR